MRGPQVSWKLVVALIKKDEFGTRTTRRRYSHVPHSSERRVEHPLAMQFRVGSLYQPVIRGRSRPVRATTSDSTSEDREKFAANSVVPTSVRDLCDIEYFSPFLLLLPPPALATISRSPPPLIHQDFRCPPRLRDMQYHL